MCQIWHKNNILSIIRFSVIFIQQTLNTHLYIFCATVLYTAKFQNHGALITPLKTARCALFFLSRLATIWQQDSVLAFVLQELERFSGPSIIFLLQIRGSNNLFALQNWSMTSLVVIKQMYVKTESVLQRDYFFIYTEKHHVSAENSKEHMHDDYSIFTVAQPDDFIRFF